MHDGLCRAHDRKGSERGTVQEWLPGDGTAGCEPNEGESADAMQRMQRLAFDAAASGVDRSVRGRGIRTQHYRLGQ